MPYIGRTVRVWPYEALRVIPPPEGAGCSTPGISSPELSGLATERLAAAISSAVTFCGWWQAARWPPAYSVSCGSTALADLGRARAARVEPAARRRADRVRRLAGDEWPRPGPVLVRVRDRDRAEQRRRVRVDRLVVELLGGRELHHLAEVHDRDPVGDVAHDAEVVGDEHVGQLRARPGDRRAG